MADIFDKFLELIWIIISLLLMVYYWFTSSLSGRVWEERMSHNLAYKFVVWWKGKEYADKFYRKNKQGYYEEIPKEMSFKQSLILLIILVAAAVVFVGVFFFDWFGR